jgi:hypothetical protein
MMRVIGLLGFRADIANMFAIAHHFRKGPGSSTKILGEKGLAHIFYVRSVIEPNYLVGYD